MLGWDCHLNIYAKVWLEYIHKGTVRCMYSEYVEGGCLQTHVHVHCVYSLLCIRTCAYSSRIIVKEWGV